MSTQTNHIPGTIREAKAIGSIAMVFVLVSFSMLFATLFMGYAALRNSAPVWPPSGMTNLPLLLPILSTVFIGLSSLTWLKFEQTLKSIWVQLTLVLGLAFTASQFALWAKLKQQGIFADTGVYASIIYTFTWIHVAHIAAAIILLLWPLYWARKNLINDLRAVKIVSIGKFWHFLGLIWGVMFVTLFVL
ncbi:MAG: hypothetical protein CME71_08170 [Halobacteriovorax sp.]|nr:hypothetical protein [Halobacteriovorax sp.]|tara:strand:- start:1330 stop:1899 length:570 start_codon:yes stop_codon:yes gene_type:complete